jgi:nanoRNase/pAp phosphatase (c-di-AMP/oligoRNAs hydrolase)
MLVNQENFKKKLLSIINKYNKFIIIPHYNPDPDALASSFGMYYLLNKAFNKKSEIYFSGIIGRAENNKMIQLLEIPIFNLKTDEDLPDHPVILMDTQPGTGNNPLKNRKNLKIVIDHHPLNEKSSSISFADIRLNYGSCSTIICNYLKEFNIKPTVNVATALYYGIETDTIGEGRTAYKIDFNYMEDMGKYINREKLYLIENPKLPFDYFININKSLANSVIYNDFVICSLGEIGNPDYIGEFADFIIRFDKCYLALVMGTYKDIIQLSFRSQRKKINAGLILKKIVGQLGTAGGHASSSGARIYIKDDEDIAKINKKIITQALKIIQGKITSGVPLLSLGDYLNY